MPYPPEQDHLALFAPFRVLGQTKRAILNMLPNWLYRRMPYPPEQDHLALFAPFRVLGQTKRAILSMLLN